MATVINITVPPPQPVTITITGEALAPVEIHVTIPPAVAVNLAIADLPAEPVEIIIAEARPGADGDPGPPGADGDPGPAGANAEFVIMANLAAYYALPVETQMDGRWYVIPRVP